METTPAPAATPASSTSELPAGGAAPADGGVATSEQHTETTPAPQPAPAPEPASTPQEGRAAQRFSVLSRERNQALQDAAYWRGVAEASRGGQNAPQQPAAEPQAPVDAKPDPTKYASGTFDASYLEDVAAWAGRQEARKLADKTREDSETAAREAEERRVFEQGKALFNNVLDAADELEAAEPRYAGASQQLIDIARSEPFGAPGRLADLIIRTENPAHIAGHFKNRPDHLAQIRQLDPYSRGVVIGRLDREYTVFNSRQRGAQPAPAAAAAPNPNPAPSPMPAPTAPNSGGAPFDPSRPPSFEAFQAYARQKREEAARSGGIPSGS